MTTTGPVTSPTAPVRRSWSGWRTFFVIIGSLLILAGGASLIGGVVGLWTHAQRDANGYHTAGPERLTTDAFVLTAPSMDVGITGPDAIAAGDLLGDVRITVTSTKDTPVFVGIGPADDVAKYLDGVRRSEVADFDADPFTVSYVQHPGGEPTADPTTQDFWAASDSGTGTRTLTWNVANGNWSIVVMNADRSGGSRRRHQPRSHAAGPPAGLHRRGRGGRPAAAHRHCDHRGDDRNPPHRRPAGASPTTTRPGHSAMTSAH